MKPHDPHHTPSRAAHQAQISVTIILAILLVAILGGIIYQASILLKERTRKQIEAQTMTTSKIVPIHDYVQACLDLASKDSLILLGQQAGYLFAGRKGSITEGQGGPTEDFAPSQAGVRYLIDPDDPRKIIPFVIFKREHTTVVNWLYSDPPLYPYATFPMWRLENDSAQDPPAYDGRYHFDGIFSANLLPRLDGIQPLPDFLDPSRQSKPIPSIKDQLEATILNHTLSCIDFSAFHSSDLYFLPGTPAINLTLLNGTIIHFHYPIRMTDRTTGAHFSISEWVTTLPVRLSYFHDVLDFAASRESDTLLFFMSNLSTPDGTVTPTVRKAIKPASHDYVVTYTDTASIIDGKPYTFRFAIHNRPPALYYPNRTVSGATYDPKLRPGPSMDLNNNDVKAFTVCASKTKDGDPLPATVTIINRGEGDLLEIQNARVPSASPQCPQEPLRIPIFALDPDEDIPAFTVGLLGQDATAQRVDPDLADLLEHRHERLVLTIKASDGEYSDSHDLILPAHYEPPPHP